uniref:Uncharacterized protein n=1 Tax=Entomoneis paludosa TaxID=265537 RepID=A0A7S2YIB5_9STRA|mmetsp:Transcript_34240/g.71275  ORF Transcript_34240/g.71275 Transcript_34240/m.71275 type:complete len:111 (+) Transcript_34240:30-362(+)
MYNKYSIHKDHSLFIILKHRFQGILYSWQLRFQIAKELEGGGASLRAFFSNSFRSLLATIFRAFLSNLTGACFLLSNLTGACFLLASDAVTGFRAFVLLVTVFATDALPR